MIRKTFSAEPTQANSSICPEALEQRMLLSAGGQNLFARTATTDLNGDTLPDIVVGTTGKGRANNASPVVLLATGANTYAAPVPVTVPAGAGASVAIADVNADGRGDLIVSGSRKGARGSSNPNSPLLLLGNGNGTFGTASSLNVPKTPGATYAFTVGDFNGDTRPDIAIEGGRAPRQAASGTGGTTIPKGARQILLLLGSGTGTFAAPAAVPITMSQVAGLTSGRFGSATGDDLVVAGRGTSRGVRGQGLTLFRNLTNTTGATAIPIAGAFGNITDAGAGDFNKDGKLDVVVASRGGTAGKGGLTLLSGNGDGTFAAGAPIAAAPARTNTVDVADFNADTNTDLLAGGAKVKGKKGYISTLSLLSNTGTGTFQAAAPITVAGA